MSLPEPPPPRTDWAMFIDFDGTLVEIERHPDAIRVEEGLGELLAGLSARLDGALAVVSGRPISDLDRHLARRFAAAGLHGLELRSAPDGRVARQERNADLRAALERLAPLLDAESGVWLEDKGASAALHYRDRPSLGPLVVAEVARALDGSGDLHALAGKMVVEIKPRSADKGRAVRAFMASPPFAGRVPVFAGDDVTDEDGFAAAASLGGIGIKVGEGETCAGYRIAGVAALLAWLAGLDARLSRMRRMDSS